MKEYTYSEARQRFAAILERARREGAVRIRRKDGTVFVLQPEAARQADRQIFVLEDLVGPVVRAHRLEQRERQTGGDGARNRWCCLR